MTWTSESNVFVSDNVVASNPTGGGTSKYLECTDFDFTIPSGSTIKGILVEIEQRGLIGTVADHSVKLIKGGTKQGDDKSAGANWPASDTYASFGGLADLWGLTWTPEDINATNFGVGFACIGNPSGTANVDHVRITVRYDTGDLNILHESVFVVEPSILGDDYDVVSY